MCTRHDTAVSTPSPAEVLGPVVTAIDHVGFAVHDLDAAIEFYGRAFGLPLVHRETNEEQGVEEAMVGIGDSCIQLLAALAPDSADREVPRAQRRGHPAGGVPGRPTSRSPAQRLRDAGLRLLYDAPRRGTAGSRINFVHPKDAGGVLIELVEPAPEH